MGNYSNKITTVSQVISEKNMTKQIARLISNLDSDFYDVSQKLAEAIVQKNSSIKGVINSIKKLSFPSDFGLNEDLDQSEFILNNRCYCRGFKVNLSTIDNNKTKVTFVLSV